MRDTVKIAIGIFVGLALCVGACCGGVLLFGATLPAPGEQMEQTMEEIFYPTPEPVVEEEISPLGTTCMVEGIEVSVTEYQERDFLSGGVDWEGKEIRREPPEGAKFISIHLVAKNVGEVNSRVPSRIDDFSLIYKGTAMEWSLEDEELKAHVVGWAYEIYPGVVCEDWNTYQVPKAADPGEMVVRLKSGEVRCTWGLGER